MLEVKEMNANILIAIHNVKQFDRLFEMARANIANLPHFVEAYISTNCNQKVIKD